MRLTAWQRRRFTFQPRRPLQFTAPAHWWYWIPAVLVIGVIFTAVLLGHTSPQQSRFIASGVPSGPPAGELQIVDRSLGNGWSIRAFDNASAGAMSPPKIAYEVLVDGAGVAVRRGPFPFGTTPHFAVPGLALMRGDPDGDVPTGWRWTTFYEVTDTSITSVRAMSDGQVVDSMKPVKLDGIRFVILTTDDDASRVHVQGLSRAGRVLATIPIADPTFGKTIP